MDIFGVKDIYARERVDGDIPYIIATTNNNGIGYMVYNDNKTLESGCISVNRNGSVGYAFYQPYEALYGNDTRKLKLKCKEKHFAKFLAYMIWS